MFFFFNDTATTEIYTLSLHDALPISDLAALRRCELAERIARAHAHGRVGEVDVAPAQRDELSLAQAGERRHQEDRRVLLVRSEEHTSELQSRQYLVCRLLLEKKKKLN